MERERQVRCPDNPKGIRCREDEGRDIDDCKNVTLVLSVGFVGENEGRVCST